MNQSATAGHPQTPTGRLPRGLARNGVWAVADQCLVSGTNFVAGWMLARLADESEYGNWAMALSAMTMLNAVQNAVFTVPMMMLAPRREGAPLRHYVSALGLAQCGAAAAISLLALAVAPLVCWLLGNEKLLAPWLAMGVAVLFVHGQEFCRRVLYAKLRLPRVFFLDLVYCGLQIAGFYLLWRLGGGQWQPSNPGWLSGRNAMLVTAASAIAGLAVGLWQIRPYLEYAASALRESIGDNWRLGKPGLGGLLGETFQTQGTLALVNMMTGAVGTALVEAPRLLLAPLNILHFAGVNVLTPRAAEQIAQHGKASLARQIPRMAALWLIPFVGYPVLVMLAPGLWLNLVYGGKWDHAVHMVQLWAIGQSVAGLRVFPWILVNALMRPDLYMRGSVTTGLVSLAASALFISQMGAKGVLLGRLVGDAVMLAWGALAVTQLLREDPREPLAAEGSAAA